jgi:hypothetical protein
MQAGKTPQRLRQALERSLAGVVERRAQQEVFRRVTRKRELGREHDMCAPRDSFFASAQDQSRIAFKIAQYGIDLRYRYSDDHEPRT